MLVNVRYFASIRESIGLGAEQVHTAQSTVGALRAELVARGAGYAEGLSGGAVRAALDQVMCTDESVPLREGCEVAFFPPVTGG